MNILVSVVTVLLSDPVPVSVEQNSAKFCFANLDIKRHFLFVDRGRKAKSNFFQNVFK